MIVLGVDPGREKCGVAVVNDAGLLWKGICNTVDLVELCCKKSMQHQIETAVVGNGTSSKTALARLQAGLPAVKIVSVDEYRTTDAAKTRYWRENPPRGFRRFIPEGMRVLPAPVDDYAAWILAERYIASQQDEAQN